MAMNVNFAKMNGLGNKIIVADLRGRADKITPQAAIALHGEGGGDTSFDQIMAIHDPRTAETDAYIMILNSDGSEAEACGNGTRCVVTALAAETGQSNYCFETLGGILNADERDNGLVSVDMGRPRFRWDQIPLEEEFADTTGIELQIGPIDAPVLHTPSVANMGNPHAIFWVKEDVWGYELDKFGPLLENHPIFPERANISIAQIVSRDHIIIRTWERGVGLTLACGSAACATAVASVRKETTDRNVTVTVPGGDLNIIWRDDDHVVMTGATEWEFAGKLDPESGQWLRIVEGNGQDATE